MRLNVLILTATAACGLGQNLSLGVMGGTNLTRGITSTTTPIAGAMLEWSLPRNFSIEADGLYHSYPEGPQLDTVVTWEFPVLAKYKFQLPFGKPFVEAGPSFRIGAPTSSGFSVGTGVEFHAFHKLNIAPTFRYTHWAFDLPGSLASWNPNQVEFLTAFSSTPGEDSHPLGRRVSIGVVLGVTLTPDFRTAAGPVIVEGYNGTPSFTLTSVSTPGPDSFLIGPSLEIQLPLNLSVEVDAIRRPISQGGYWTVPSGTTLTAPQSAAFIGLNARPSSTTDITWDFPLLAKYKFRLPWAAPFVALGPSFRLPQSVNGGNLSTYGITAGVGIQAHLLHVEIAPELRFTRWASPNYNTTYYTSDPTRFIPNQLEFLTTLSFP